VFHPHLPLLATGSDDTAKLWLVNSNGTSATCTATLGGHTDDISSVAFHPCLPLAATICRNFSLKVWVLNSEGTAATCTAFLKGKGYSVYYLKPSVTFHPHLPLLAANCDDECNQSQVKLWLLNFDYTSATCAATFYGMFDFIGFHPCLPLLAIRSNDNTVKLWSLNSDGTAPTCTSTLKGIIGESGHTSGSVAFHPRLPLLATVFYSLQLSQKKRTPITSTTNFRFCFCPEPRPQMPVMHMLAGGSTGTALEHGGSGFWTSKGAPYSMNMFDSDSDGN
jgi:WD40 repeat protein